MWDTLKHMNIHFMGVPEEQDKDKLAEKVFHEIAENFPNLILRMLIYTSMKLTKLQVGWTQRDPHPDALQQKYIMIETKKM